MRDRLSNGIRFHVVVFDTHTVLWQSKRLMVRHGCLSNPNAFWRLRKQVVPVLCRCAIAAIIWIGMLPLASIAQSQPPTRQLAIPPSPPLRSQTQPSGKTTQSAELGSHVVAAADSFPVDTRLELHWSALQAKPWKIRLAIAADDAGRFSQLENHCQYPESVSGFSVSGDGRSIVFTSPVGSKEGELQIRFAGQSDSRLIITNDDPSSQPSDAPSATKNNHSKANFNTASPNSVSEGSMSEASASEGSVVDDKVSQGNASQNNASQDNAITLAALLRGGDFSVVDDSIASQPTLTLRRQADDELKVQFADQSMYRQSQQDFSLTVHANALRKVRSRELKLSYQLFRVADGEMVAGQDYRIHVDSQGNSVPIEINQNAPQAPGVYEVRCQLFEDSAAIWSRLRRSIEPLAKTQIVMIVEPPRNADSAIDQTTRSTLSWEKIGEIQPAQKPDWELRQWLPGSLQKSSLATSSTGSTAQAGLVQAKHDGQVVSLLDPKGTYATRLPRLQSGKPHRLTVHYPAGQRLNLRVELSPDERMDRQRRTFVLRDAPSLGQEHRWQSQSILYYPTHRDQFVRLTNATDHQVISFKSMTIDVGQSQTVQPAAPAPDNYRTAMLQLSDFGWIDSLVEPESTGSKSNDFHPASVAADRLTRGIDRLKEYLSLAGYNAIAIPGNHQGQTLYTTDQFAPMCGRSPIATRRMDMILHAMHESGVDVYVGIEPSLSTFYDDHMLNPVAQGRLTKWLSELDQQCLVHKSYAGLVINQLDQNHGDTDHDLRLLGEEQLRRFIAESEWDADTTPPAKATFAQLRAWSMIHAQAKLRHWCESQSLLAYQRIASKLRGKVLLRGGTTPTIHQNLLPLVAVQSFTCESSGSNTKLSDNRSSVGQNVRTVFPATAISIGISDQFDGVDAQAAPWIDGRSTTNRLVQAVNHVDPQWLVVPQNRLSLQWDESFSTTLKDFKSLPLGKWHSVAATVSEDETAPSTNTTRLRHTTVGGQSVLVLSNLAPWKTNVEINCQSALQWQPDLTQTDSQSGVASLSLSLDPGAMVLLRAANPNEINPIRSWTSRVSGGEQTLTQIKNNVTTVVKRIGTLSQPESYRVLSNGGFEQAGPFEGSGNPTIVGWLHTQHPADAVRIDSTEAIDGKRSVVLTTNPANSGRTWIVSEQFKPPSSGRLAVSMAVRGELIPQDQTKQIIQVSIEGTRDREPIRHSQTIEINRDGQWQTRRVVLEADNLTPTAIDSIRLTIDSLSRGRVWIDDVQLHDRFPLASERRKLQDEAFMAVQGLQHGSLTSASSLLQNYWAQQLLSPDDADTSVQRTAVDSIAGQSWSEASRDKRALAVPSARRITKPTNSSAPLVKTAKSQRSRTQPAKPKPPAKPAGVAERIKGWLPRPLRF